MLSANDFYQHLLSLNLQLNDLQLKKASQFAEILHRENKKQNLTRITGVSEYYDGHLLDVIEMFKLQGLGQRVLDLGSGCGVPGLLGGAIDESSSRQWFLVDAEGMKADYLSSTATEMSLGRISVFNDRTERIISDLRPDTVIARAVGSVEKIASWIFECSTWNNLILFKSRGWDDEWKQAQTSRFGKKLTISHIHEYSTGGKYRVLVTLKRK